MIGRRQLIEEIIAECEVSDRIVVGLGFTARELYRAAGAARDRSFYCLGSMGSAVPLALGFRWGRPDLRTLVIEGDGSLLSNLGTLATLARYGDSGLAVVVVDNGVYESSGGQPCQPIDLRLEHFPAAAGLATNVVSEFGQLRSALAVWGAPGGRPIVIVAKTRTATPAARITDDPHTIAARFTAALPPVDIGHGPARLDVSKARAVP